MRAITQEEYGLDSLVLSEIPTPKVGSKQILVKERQPDLFYQHYIKAPSNYYIA
jgi:hypothetical protein